MEVQEQARRRHVVAIGPLLVGTGDPVVIAGPCSVEPSYPEHAARVAAQGVDALRACVFKPRTRPDSFQGLGRHALPLALLHRRHHAQEDVLGDRVGRQSAHGPGGVEGFPDVHRLRRR